MQNAIAAVRFFASERQLRALAAKLRAPLNQFFNAFRSIFHEDSCRFRIAETITCVQRVLKMQADLVFIAQRGCDSALRAESLSSRLASTTTRPALASSIAARRPAIPAPITTKSVSAGAHSIWQKCYHFACTAAALTITL